MKAEVLTSRPSWSAFPFPSAAYEPPLILRSSSSKSVLRPRLSAREQPFLRFYVEVLPGSHCFAQFPGLGRPVKGESVYTSSFNPERPRVGSPQAIMQKECQHRQENHPEAGEQVPESVAYLGRRVFEPRANPKWSHRWRQGL